MVFQILIENPLTQVLIVVPFSKIKIGFQGFETNENLVFCMWILNQTCKQSNKKTGVTHLKKGCTIGIRDRV